MFKFIISNVCPFVRVLVEDILMKGFLVLELHFSYTVGKNLFTDSNSKPETGTHCIIFRQVEEIKKIS